jgi:hypothetical protein
MDKGSNRAQLCSLSYCIRVVIAFSLNYYLYTSILIAEPNFFYYSEKITVIILTIDSLVSLDLSFPIV